MDREEFARRQAEMTDRWSRNLTASGVDVSAYVEQRKLAYLGRWREAARFIADGANVLDIGGGNLWPGLLRFFQSRHFNYYYVDVDPACVAGAKAIAAELGLDVERFSHGFNDKFSFPDQCFDAIFSSHCVEHSFDLTATMSELWRMLRPGGLLLMAVPFGWEANPEHPYFFGPADWISLTEDAGFEVRVAQVGREYPEIGWDYFIAARKADPIAELPRLSVGDYIKTSFEFIYFDDPAIDYGGKSIVAHDHRLCHSDDWTIRIALPEGVTEVLPVCANHPWSGVVEITCGEVRVVADLYSWFEFALPIRLKLAAATAPGASLVIRPLGRNASSRGASVRSLAP